MKIEGMGAVDMTNGINRKQASEDQAFEEILKKAYSEGDKEKLQEVCKEFEGLFLQTMYKQMKKTVPESDFLPKSTGREIFEDMLDEEMMNNAKERGVGMADILYRQLSRNMDTMYTVQNEKKD